MKGPVSNQVYTRASWVSYPEPAPEACGLCAIR
jgi:hypothetical protein